MLANYIKSVLELVPEAMPMIKQASVDQDLPTNGKDSSIASALAIEYMLKIAHKPVDITEMEKVAHAVELYAVGKEVSEFKTLMVKRANEQREKVVEDSIDSYLLKEAYFKGELSGSVDYSKVAETASLLYKEASEKGATPSEEVVMYSGHGHFSKEAAMKSLTVRYNLTKEPAFVKLASAISHSVISPDLLSTLCSRVMELDKSAGLTLKGFNFYKETILTKEAAVKSALLVKIDGKDVPYEKIEKLGKARISQYIGADVAKEMDGGPANFKSVAETLPLDLQRVLSNLLKNV